MIATPSSATTSSANTRYPRAQAHKTAPPVTCLSPCISSFALYAVKRRNCRRIATAASPAAAIIAYVEGSGTAFTDVKSTSPDGS